MASFHSPLTDQLFDVISNLKTKEECYALFEDMCTIKEILDMSQRLEIAILLHQGKSYQYIADQMGISTATISRVSRCLEYGTGGYKTAIEEIKKNR